MMLKSKPSPKGKAKGAIKAANPVPKNIMAEDRKWQAEEDARTLMRANEIMADKPRHSRAKSVAAKQIAALSKVAKK